MLQETNENFDTANFSFAVSSCRVFKHFNRQCTMSSHNNDISQRWTWQLGSHNLIYHGREKKSAGNTLKWLKIVYRNNTENKSIISHWAKKVKVLRKDMLSPEIQYTLVTVTQMSEKSSVRINTSQSVSWNVHQ